LKSRNIEYQKNFKNILAVCLLKFYGLISRPFKFKYLGWVSYFITKYIQPGSICTAKLSSDTSYRFFLEDGYWNKLFCQRFFYEPEIGLVLKSIRELDYLFLDLGANHGYWSVLVSSDDFNNKEAVAIEPVRSNFNILSENSRINNHRFTVMHAAVCELEGQNVKIYFDPKSHSNVGASLLPDVNAHYHESESIESATINQLVGQFAHNNQALVIKLDVEGMEVETLKGASIALERDFLLIYEDHGSDPNHTCSEFVLKQGFAVFHMESGVFTPVSSLEEVESMKVQSSKGYNLFAYKPDSVISRLIHKNLLQS